MTTGTDYASRLSKLYSNRRDGPKSPSAWVKPIAGGHKVRPYGVRCLCEAVWKTMRITVENGVDNYVRLSSGGIFGQLSARKNEVFHRFMLKKNINFVNLHQNRECG